MQKYHQIAGLLAVGLCFVLTDNASAQEWNTTVQPVASDATSQPNTETKNWNATLGGGIGYVPVYEGADDYKVMAVPVIHLDYRDGLFFANGHNGIGSYPLQGKNYKVGASVGYAMGRDEDDSRKNLRGMGDVDASATANFLAEYDFGPAYVDGKITTAVSGDYGTTAEINLGSRHPVSEKIILSGSVGTVWADEEHMSNRFGVSGAQSVASGYSQHNAESGMKSVGFSVGATYLMTDAWNANLTFRGDKLLGDASDSPVVKEDFVPAVFLTTSYKF